MKDVEKHGQGGSIWPGLIDFEAPVSEPLTTISTSHSSLILVPAGSSPVCMVHLAP